MSAEFNGKADNAPSRQDTVLDMGNPTGAPQLHNFSYALSSQQFDAFLNRIAPPTPPPPPPSGLGNPGPLGLGAFALTTFVLSAFNAGVFIDAKLEPVVLPLALFYGGLAQFAAGMWEFKTNNTFGATAFSSYGAFWMSFAGYVFFIVPAIEASAVAEKLHQATGIFLFAWLLFTLYMNVAAWRVSKAVFWVFTWLSITFLLLSIGALAESSRCTKAGGWFGLITAFCAWYGSAAVVINSTYGHEVLPIGAYVPPKRHGKHDTFSV